MDQKGNLAEMWTSVQICKEVLFLPSALFILFVLKK